MVVGSSAPALSLTLLAIYRLIETAPFLTILLPYIGGVIDTPQRFSRTSSNFLKELFS